MDIIFESEYTDSRLLAAGYHDQAELNKRVRFRSVTSDFCVDGRDGLRKIAVKQFRQLT